ncbi:glycosyltransferase [Bacteroidota bacterium]
MKLSVVIVNYNVKFFLEQCLLSVRIAADHLKSVNPAFNSEIFVVDNNSVDSSTTMLKEKFPEVVLIENTENKGFSFANNQALQLAKGEYQLLLNPDTVLEESTFSEIIDFMDSHPDAGGLGVKMIDGSGKYLPESKRSLPTPSTAFYKIFGLSMLFPNSKQFGKYHLGYLDENEIHKVEVLSGAFLLIRKSALEKTGLLDETFFMYGEDIDFSYRIIKAGYTNYYYPKTSIIHYKGESTKKGSVNYVFTFYRAMIIFARKHFSAKNARLFSFMIHTAIYFRAFLSITKRFLFKIILPIADIFFIYFGLLAGKLFWEKSPFGHGSQYPKELILYVFPLFTLLWITGLWFSKSYKKPYSLGNILKGIIVGSFFISTVYAFFEESFRFSRALIILGTISSIPAAYFVRIISSYITNKSFKLNFRKEVRIVIVGSPLESERVAQLLIKSNISYTLLGYICPENQQTRKPNYLGSLSQISEIVKIHKVNELIFCADDVPSSTIIKIMSELEGKEVVFKIAPQKSLFIIGSHSKNETGDLYTLDIRLEISRSKNKINKRILDISASIVLILTGIIFIWIQKSKAAYFTNLFHILTGRKSIVGYNETVDTSNLPAIKTGILYSSELIQVNTDDTDLISEYNLIYARDYSPVKDLTILKKGIKKLGSK